MNVHKIAVRFLFVTVTLWGSTASLCVDASKAQNHLDKAPSSSARVVCLSDGNCTDTARESDQLVVNNDH
jgi:hypothetical protein